MGPEGVNPRNDDFAERELAERELALHVAKAKSNEDLKNYLATTRADASEFKVLSSGAQKRFLQSLRFSEKGLSSFDYRDLQAELSPTQIYQLLSLFGVQRSTASIPGLRVTSPADEMIVALGGGGWPPGDSDLPVDYPDKWCESRATCRFSTGAICIGDNC